MTIKFSEKAHRYWLDGRPIPGVTSLIKGGYPSPALTYWSARTVAEWVADNRADVEQMWDQPRATMVGALKEVPWSTRDRAAVRGTEVHRLAEPLAAGEAVEVPEHLAGWVDACVAFLNDWQPTVLLSEVTVAHRAHWWAGRLDLVAELPDGRVGLFDWKTGSGVYAEAAFQLAAYAHAEFYSIDGEEEIPLPRIDFGACVHLSEFGYEVVPVDISDATYKTFRHIATVARAAKGAKALVGEPVQLGETA